MSTAALPAPPATGSRRIEPEQHFVLAGLSWEQYVAISDALPNRIQAFRRTEASEYEPIEYSLAFPFLRVADLLPFVFSERWSCPGCRRPQSKSFKDWLYIEGVKDIQVESCSAALASR